ncbi:hypothetical protein [Mesorhizobium sp.]|nr:hypothetical protein [Mesorhizobium sp.]
MRFLQRDAADFKSEVSMSIIEYERQVLRLFQEEPKWRIAPFGVTYRVDTKERVYFDYDNRPILRVGPDGKGEIISPDAFVYFSMLADLLMDFDGHYDPDGLKIVTDVIDKHGLAPELRRRWELFQRDELPDPAWGGRP